MDLIYFFLCSAGCWSVAEMRKVELMLGNSSFVSRKAFRCLPRCLPNNSVCVWYVVSLYNGTYVMNLVLIFYGCLFSVNEKNVMRRILFVIKSWGKRSLTCTYVVNLVQILCLPFLCKHEISLLALISKNVKRRISVGDKKWRKKTSQVSWI